MKVKFIKSHPDFAYFAGDIAEGLSEAHVTKLLQSGHVQPIVETPETASIPKAETATKKPVKK